MDIFRNDSPLFAFGFHCLHGEENIIDGRLAFSVVGGHFLQVSSSSLLDMFIYRQQPEGVIEFSRRDGHGRSTADSAASD